MIHAEQPGVLDAGTPVAGVDVSMYRNRHSWRNKLGRAAWNLVWLLFFRPTPRIMSRWRILLLRLFGARIGRGCHVYSSCRVWAPWNLTMGDYACLGHDVDCYTVDRVEIEAHATVSQYSFLCTASHDIASPNMELVTAPITIGSQAWIAAGAFIGPGVHVGVGAVVAARAVVVRNVGAWNVVGGNPARVIKSRVLRESEHAPVQ